MTEPVKIAIACQGGGSHTAFTAGVLGRLFEESTDGYSLVGLSGTSGGAVCAALTWATLRTDEPTRVGPVLNGYWADNAATSPVDQMIDASVTAAGMLSEFVPLPEVSPYDNPYEPTVARGFKEMLERRVEFDGLTPVDDDGPVLVIGAVDVLSGEFRAFDSRRDAITPDTILASAAIPTLFRSVPVGGGLFWDGLFSQNPPIRELVALAPDEIWVIQVNPSRRDTEPRSMIEINDRRNELSGNLSLYQELRFIEQLDQLLEAGLLAQDGPFKRIVVRIIELTPSRVARPLGVRTKVNRSVGLIEDLVAHGRAQAQEFLAALAFEAALRLRDVDAVVALVDDDVELVVRAPLIELGPVRGRARLAAFLGDNLDALEVDLTHKQLAREAVTWIVRSRTDGRRLTLQVRFEDGMAAALELGAADDAI